MTILETKVTITNKLGLHARAASKLAQLCTEFDAEVTLELEGNQADASSIMALMLLAGGQGKEVTVKTRGSQAEEALASICRLITDKFDESE
ncbi:HPr family phosphocarrier protein [Thalassomonas haliotis]|uniref:HPr family phosphocarrier protein n=1 Tax=Thalassomonas haliotis TaxID=485448 RepID=A0ABY7VBJ7_9GAMM|nr:HPr family phosphocarrier protein [Thalassomonas haliotis]WDE10891.1 HPr family phosphocarrier protein [Thalassomonas haliotis]